MFAFNTQRNDRRKYYKLECITDDIELYRKAQKALRNILDENTQQGSLTECVPNMNEDESNN